MDWLVQQLLKQKDKIWQVLNHHFFQKLKLIGNGEFNHLLNTLTFLIMGGLKFSLNK